MVEKVEKKGVITGPDKTAKGTTSRGEATGKPCQNPECGHDVGVHEASGRCSALFGMCPCNEYVETKSAK